jgi:hypothetical protein
MAWSPPANERRPAKKIMARHMRRIDGIPVGGSVPDPFPDDAYFYSRQRAVSSFIS